MRLLFEFIAMRRQIATVAVVALLVAAGCSTGGGPATTDASTTDGSNGATPAGDPLYETPLDANAVAEAHLDGLQDAGSYTIVSNATRASAAGNQSSSSVVRGDLSTGAMYIQSAAAGGTAELFRYGNGTAYQRVPTGDQTRYVNATGRVGNASQYARGTVASFVGLFDFTYAGTATESGATVHVYEANGAETVNTSSPAFSQFNESAIRSANATLQVRENGVVTLAGYDLTVRLRGAEQSVVATQRFTDVGSTEVTPPDWLAEARGNETASQSTTTSASRPTTTTSQ